MNLGGPDSAAAVEPFLFNLFRDPAIISFAEPAALVDRETDRAAARAGRAADLCEDRQCAHHCCRTPKRRRRARRRRWAARRASSSPCAIGGRAPTTAAEAVKAWDAGRDRAAAALSAILEHHDGVIAGRLASGGEGGRHRPRRRARCAAIRPKRDSSPRWPTTSHEHWRNWPKERGMPRLLAVGAWSAEAHRRARRSLSVADRANRGAGARCGRPQRYRDASSAIKAGSGRSNGWDRRRMRKSAGPEKTVSGSSSRRSPSCRNIRKRWSSSISNTGMLAEQAACRIMYACRLSATAPSFIAGLARLVATPAEGTKRAAMARGRARRIATGSMVMCPCRGAA